VIYFKRPVYTRALTELAGFAFPNGAPTRPGWWHEVMASEPQAAPADTAID
jgi:hypothetical protein